MLNQIRHLIIGSPLPSERSGERRLDKVRALASLSPDALASIAYANQEIYLGLLVAGAAGLAHAVNLAIVITGLLGIVTLSYRQTIDAYPSGGGSYTVARENLGDVPGLTAAAALLMSYLLNAAVSLTAGVAAIASAYPALWAYRVPLALALLIIITLINLRGAREAGTAMTIPVYLFLATYLGLIAWGIIVALRGGPGTFPAVIPGPAASAPSALLVPVTLALLLRTFASGATALTGVEAISNAVPVFEPPETTNAKRTMIIMALLMGVLFIGTVGLTQYLAVVAGPNETILSALARRLFGTGPLYLLVQAATLLVLVVAANTSYAGFPRVVSIMARDGFMPRQLRAVGDRLVFSNGILLLTILTGVLIVVFGGDTHALIPLFAVGAFLAFTLSQAGMVTHWWRERGPGWRAKAILNGCGALATGVALLVIGASKFAQGAGDRRAARAAAGRVLSAHPQSLCCSRPAATSGRRRSADRLHAPHPRRHARRRYAPRRHRGAQLRLLHGQRGDGHLRRAGAGDGRHHARALAGGRSRCRGQPGHRALALSLAHRPLPRRAGSHGRRAR